MGGGEEGGWGVLSRDRLVQEIQISGSTIRNILVHRQ